MYLIIFKTNVVTRQQAKELEPLLTSHPQVKEHNFDLDDCDNILRIVSTRQEPRNICHLLEQQGFSCEEMESFVYD